MAVSDHVDFARFIEGVKRRNPGQPEYVQAVQEVAEHIFDFIQDKEEYHELCLPKTSSARFAVEKRIGS